MDITGYKLRPTKHFIKGWMRKWDWDMEELRSFIESSTVEKVGKSKFEMYKRNKGKSRKIIVIKDDANKEILIITGAEGK